MPGIWTTSHLAALACSDPQFTWVPQPLDLSGQTVRQHVRLRRGGTAVRLELSNEYGDGPLVIGALTVATSGDVQPVLRNGRARWEIPAGQTAASDPVPLATAAGDELAVSFYVDGRAPAASYLHSAQRTGQHAPGNQTGQAVLAGASEFRSLYWLTRVLVNSPADGPVVVALGDSITRGDVTSPGRDQRYPDHLQRRLLAAGLSGAVVLNAGIGANRLLRTGLGPSMTSRFARDVLSVPEATHVIIMGGVNDLGLPAVSGEDVPAADEIAAGLLALAARASEHGIQPVLGTMTPFRSSGLDHLRQAANKIVTSQLDWPVADFAAAVAAPGDPATLDPALDAGDGLHPGDDGARALAGAIDLAFFA